MQPLIDIENYFITECGKVFSKDRVREVSPRGYKQVQLYKGKELKQQVTNSGYLQVGLYIEGVRKVFSVHRLVALCYLPNPENLDEVNHKDFDKLNNHVSNLEWVSRKENLQHAWDNGKKLKGSKIGTSKLSSKDVLTIAELLSVGISQTEIAEQFNVSNHAIHRIAKGHSWSWLTQIGRREGEQ